MFKFVSNLSKGLIYCYLWISSIISGYMGLFCPILPILFISNNFYRKLTDILFTFWQQYNTALLQFLCGTRIIVTGDPIVPGTTSLLVMNHRTRTDWNFLWPAIYHATCDGTKTSDRRGHDFKMLHPLKFVLKDAIRHIPGPGWVMQLACFIFIKRIWNFDQKRLETITEYFSNLKLYKYTLVLFPEGTDLTRHTKTGSWKFAEKHNLPKYEFVLHPRTKGFTCLALELLEQKELDCIHDVTLLYPDIVPQTEIDIIKGNFPKIVRMHFKRYNKEVIPKTEQELKQFLENLWQRKEQSLKDFYENGNFLGGPKLHQNSLQLYIAFIFWTLLPAIIFPLFYISAYFRSIVICHTLFLLIVNYINGGFQNFETELFNFKKKYIPRKFFD